MRGRPKGTKDKNPRKTKNRSKFILFKIEGKAYILRGIADKLDELNKEWRDYIDKNLN